MSDYGVVVEEVCGRNGCVGLKAATTRSFMASMRGVKNVPTFNTLLNSICEATIKMVQLKYKVTTCAWSVRVAGSTPVRLFQ